MWAPWTLIHIRRRRIFSNSKCRTLKSTYPSRAQAVSEPSFVSSWQRYLCPRTHFHRVAPAIPRRSGKTSLTGQVFIGTRCQFPCVYQPQSSRSNSAGDARLWQPEDYWKPGHIHQTPHEDLVKCTLVRSRQLEAWHIH